MDLQVNDRVDVYRNLRSGNFSIRKNGIVQCRADEILMSDVVFKVSQKSRERVLREKQKNVHAIVRGIYKGHGVKRDDSMMKQAYYNPYKVETFVDIDEKTPLTEASEAYLKENKVFYI
jgi:hypothetical protein